MADALTYYHGTNADLPVGTIVLPGDELGKTTWPGMDASDVVWMHDNPEWAARYGQHVYEVEPLEWVENHSADAGHTEEMASPREWEYITPRARVVRRVS